MDYLRHSKSHSKSIETLSILKPGKVPKHICFFLSEYVGLFSTDGITKYYDIPAGDVFGEGYVLFNIPASYWVKFDFSSQNYKNKDEINVEMYKVDAKSFIEILKDYPMTHKIIKKEALIKRSIYRQRKQAVIFDMKLLRERTNSNLYHEVSHK